MSLPKAFYLDTSVMDGQQYNFESVAFETFIAASAGRNLRLLLPDPTEKEIKRHIRERSQQALAALEDARRKAPFLSKWNGLARTLRTHKAEEWEVQRIANKEWSTFLTRFTVVRLGYDLVDAATVMRWYDQATPPFREGKKRREFPDAFAIAMLEAYARREQIHIAVVSGDDDFKQACQRFGSLLHFVSLPRLTELLLSDDERLQKTRAALEAKQELIEEAILDEVPAVTFYHVSERFEVHDVEVEELNIVEQSVVALGDGECTIAFDASVVVRATIRWEEFHEDGVEGREREVDDLVILSGTAKVSYDATSGAVSKVILVKFDDDEAPITESPEGA